MLNFLRTSIIIVVLALPTGPALANQHKLADRADTKVISGFHRFGSDVELVKALTHGGKAEDVLFYDEKKLAEYLARIFYWEYYSSYEAREGLDAAVEYIMKNYGTFNTGRTARKGNFSIRTSFGDITYEKVEVTDDENQELGSSCVIFSRPFDNKRKHIGGFFCRERQNLQHADVEEFFLTLGVRGVVEPGGSVEISKPEPDQKEWEIPKIDK